MSAIFLPRKWRHQPTGPVEVDQHHPIGAKVHYAYTPWLGLTSITPGRRRVTATPTAATLTASAGPYGRGVNVQRTGTFTGVGVDLDDTEYVATVSSGGAFFVLVDGIRYGDTDLVGLIKIASDDGLRISEDAGGRYLFLYLFANTRSRGYLSVPQGYTGGIGLSAADRSSPFFYVGREYEAAEILGLDFDIRAVTGIRSITAKYPTWGCPLFLRTDYLTHEEMRALDEAPWTIFRAPSHRIWFDVGGGAPAAIEGDVVAEETGVDTLAATGSVVVAGSLAAAEAGADTFAATGGAVATGTLAASETGVDTLAFAGEVLVAGSLAATETGADTVAATGKVLVAGTLNAAETGADTASVTGLVLVAGTLSAAEAGTDTFSASGAGQAAGTLAAVESGTDTITAAGQIVVSGALSASEAGSDTWAATGAVRVSGSLSASETGTDTFSSTGEQPRITGEFAASEAGTDGFAAVGIVPAIGSFDVLEAGHDTFAGAGQIIVAGILGAAEVGQDTFIATPAGSISGVMAAIEAADTFAATGHGRAPHGARRAGDRGYATQTTMRRPQVQTMRRPRQTG